MTLREAWARRVTASRTREFAVFGASMLVLQGGRFLFYVAAARALIPADFATWALVLSVLVYAPSLLLGVTNGMSRELPILTGLGDRSAAGRSERAAWAATVIACVAAVGLSLLATALVTTETMSLALAGLLAAGSIAYFTTLSNLRSRLRFDAASAQQATFGVAIVLLAILLAIDGEADLARVAVYYGLGLALALAVGLLMVRPARPSADWNELARLARIGFPIMLAGLVFSVYVTLDRWIVVALLGGEEAAPYALASLVAAATLVIPSVVSQQFYPRMGVARGGGANANELKVMARDQGLISAGLVAPVVLAITLFAWLGIPIVLPEYSDATAVIVVLGLGLLVLALFNGYGNYLNVVGGQWRYLGAQTAGLTAALSFMIVGGRLWGLIGVAAGMSLGHLVYGLVLRAVARRTDIRPGQPTETSAEPV